MNHLNIISFLCLIVFLIYIYGMIHKSQKIRDTFLKIQLLIVLCYNLGIIIVFPYKVPVEFSTLAYFIVPIIVLFNIKELKIWAVYAALLAGLGYYFSMILYGNTLYGHFPVYSVVTSLFNHGSLLAYAFITLATHKFDKTEARIIWGGLIINAVWSLSIRNLVLHPGRIFIYEILDGFVAKAFFPNNLSIAYPLYYIALVYLLWISPKLIFMLNKVFDLKIFKKKVEYNVA